MRIRNNIRERRQQRIRQLIDQHAAEQVQQPLPPVQSTGGYASAAGAPREITSDPDPEQWWKEREKQLKSGQAAGWHGLKGLPPASAGGMLTPSQESKLHHLVWGFLYRFLAAVALFAGIWGWLKFELPGSEETREWVVASVTRDMDFQAIEAWYGETFNGSPSLFSFGRAEPITKEASAPLKPDNTVPPVHGQVIQNDELNGSGVTISAAGNSQVQAIYTGQVRQVTSNAKGDITILVQHQNQILSVYGNLEKANVKPNDWVDTGQHIGELHSSGVLFFAIERDGKILNPADVVSL